MGTENKVQYGLKNVYYAKITNTGGVISYGTPVALAGGVNLNLKRLASAQKFYADNMVYWLTDGVQGYEGELELARVPDAVLKDIFGDTEGTTSKVLTENVDTESAHVALMFQIDGDADQELHVVYNVTLGRPEVASGTIKTTKEPVTQKMSLSADPRPDGKLKAKTQATTGTTVRNSWFTTVFVEQ